MSGNKFYWDNDNNNDEFYLVNFQEERYMKIAWKGSEFYPLCRHLYMSNWNCRENIIDSFRLVDRLEQIDGCED